MRTFGAADYSRSDDYDPDDALWRSISKVGSAYEEEIDLAQSRHYRHRNTFARGPWIRGLAPDSKAAD